jgi:hypothetical protein
MSEKPPIGGLVRRDAEPEWPDIGCKGDCGFTRAGVGVKCDEGQACGRYLHPGEDGRAEAVIAYYEAVAGRM